METARIMLVLPRGIRGAGDKLAMAVFRLASQGYRRFELHVYTDMEKPMYIEEIREFIQNNIAYSLAVYSHGLDEATGVDGYEAVVAPRSFIEKHCSGRGSVLVIELDGEG